MEFFDVLVRYEVALWGSVDQALARHGQIGLAHLRPRTDSSPTTLHATP